MDKNKKKEEMYKEVMKKKWKNTEYVRSGRKKKNISRIQRIKNGKEEQREE